MTSKALKRIGFILKESSAFKNHQTHKILYIPYVRSNLEYISRVWNPHYSEKVLNNFTYRTRNDVSMNLKNPNQRRDIRDLVTLYKIINSPYVLKKY